MLQSIFYGLIGLPFGESCHVCQSLDCKADKKQESFSRLIQGFQLSQLSQLEGKAGVSILPTFMIVSHGVSKADSNFHNFHRGIDHRVLNIRAFFIFLEALPLDQL